jgi:hypothetical protein
MTQDMTQDMKVYGKFTDMFKYVIEGINNKLVFNEITARRQRGYVSS